MKNFPTRAPVGMLLGAVLGFFSIVPVFAAWRHYRPPLERFYLPQYIGSTLAQTPVGTIVSFFRSRKNTRTCFVVMQDGKPVTAGRNLDPGRAVSGRLVETTPRIFGLWLRQQVYAGRSFPDVLRPPIALWIGIAWSFVVAGLVYDFIRRKRAREGVPLRGPELMTRRAFNRSTKGDGFTLHVFD
jgi:hypothetical protein